jgi:membrane protein
VRNFLGRAARRPAVMDQVATGRVATGRIGTGRLAMGQLAGGWAAGMAAVRRRSRIFDHVCRAWLRCRQVYAGRLAAAIAYYGFFAAFALAALIFAALGFALRGKGPVVHDVEAYLQHNLPQLSVATVAGSSGQVGAVALAGLMLAGVAWVKTLRSSQRAIWGLEQQPGNGVSRWLTDLAVLVALGVLAIVSVSISAGVEGILQGFVAVQHPQLRGVLHWLTHRNVGASVDMVLGAALLAWVPRLRVPLRRLVPSALVIAGGIALLKSVGRWYIAHTEHNPAYQVVAGAAGLLVFMYLFNRILLFAAALAATSEYGAVTDLAGGRRPAAAVLNHHAEEQLTAEQFTGNDREGGG